ncbi:MAG: hypothetical protein J7M14_08305 [Planctomycetes bacterium]|nr:hypothetical protein [Planctomycetota bacterium]
MDCHTLSLSGRQWLIAGAIVVATMLAAPRLWERIEKFDIPSNYRIGYELSEDYWLFSRYCRSQAAAGKIFVIGDSVVWGQYVGRDKTLSAALNRLHPGEFANAGVDGMHPLALEGLVKYYGRDISNARVILHCNLLWLASAKRDLRSDENEVPFNHPRVVPQFAPALIAYHPTPSVRIGAAVERNVEFLQMVNHVKLTYLDRLDIPAWTMEHPLGKAITPVRPAIPVGMDKPRHQGGSWIDRRIRKQNFPWVELDRSLQWAAFQRLAKMLQSRGNRVFVVVGPLNEHMLTAESLGRYHRLKDGVEAWLSDNGLHYFAPEPLDSELYADASHPLAEGYTSLAKQIDACRPFGDFSQTSQASQASRREAGE